LKTDFFDSSSEYGCGFDIRDSERNLDQIDPDLSVSFQKVLSEMALCIEEEDSGKPEGERLYANDTLNNLFQNFYDLRWLAGQAIQKKIVNQLRASNECRVVSLSEAMDHTSDFFEHDKKYDTVARVVIDKIALPSDDVPLEALIEYKMDADAQGYLYGLKEWMQKRAKRDTTSIELSEELDWLLYKHQQRLDAHRMETEQSFISLVVNSAADIAESTIKLRWGQAARTATSLLRAQRPRQPFTIDPEAGHLNYLIRAKGKLPKL